MLQSASDVELKKAIAAWRQGDCVVDKDLWFIYGFAAGKPTTAESIRLVASDAAATIVEVDVRGFAVLTQTCDIVRSFRERPFVEVAPLIEVAPDRYGEIKARRMPAYVAISALASDRLVADLDRTMTIEKAVLATWVRRPGCQSDDETRDFAKALGRKRTRFAFPDEFVNWMSPIERLIKDKHSKQTELGIALRSFREIRVRAAPSWQHDKPSIDVYFIRDSGTDSTADALRKSADALMAKLDSRFEHSHVVVTLEDLTAQQYVESDPLNLGYLSQ